MPVTAARKLAFEVLRRVEAERAFAAHLLHARLARPRRGARSLPAGQAGLKPEDAALATELTLGVLRWQRQLDFLIDCALRLPSPRSRRSATRGSRPAGTHRCAENLDLEVRLALRLGVYQLRFLTRVPARAAVNESVELVKWAGKRPAAALVNAVLRRAPAQPIEELLPAALPPAERLGVRFSHPTWLVERWLERYGEPRTVALLEANNRVPNLTCATRDDASAEQARKALTAAGLRVEPARWLHSALRILRGNPVATPVFRRGYIWIQEEASQMLARLLGVRPGQTVLDLCAAPGGKTFHFACAVGVQTPVIAADRHLHRLRAMQVQLERLGLRNVCRVALDATTALPFARRFDRILLDVPCSGTGTLAPNPEIRWRLRPADLADLRQRQMALLSNALAWLAPGGRLVYATCSLEPEENERVVEAVLAARKEFRCVPSDAVLAPHLAPAAPPETFFDAQGYFRTFPPDHQTDGFFAATIEYC
jgi:16S rRNA (cytosine967-C5)-methyltransferase